MAVPLDAGSDGIPPELLKCDLGPVSRALHSLFIQVWRSGIVPADWQEGIIITLYKGKGPRTITPLLEPGKVFAHILLNSDKQATTMYVTFYNTTHV